MRARTVRMPHAVEQAFPEVEEVAVGVLAAGGEVGAEGGDGLIASGAL